MISKPKPRARPNALTIEEINRVIKECKTKKEKLLIIGLIYMGLRISEFIHMKKSWIINNGEFISVPYTQKCSCYECKKEIYKKIRDKDTKKVIGRKIVKPSGLWRCKTSSGERKFPLVQEAREIVLNYFKNHNAIMEIIPNRVIAWTIIKRISKIANVKHKVFPHALRATFATILVSKDLKN